MNNNLRIAIRAIEMMIEERYRGTVLTVKELREHTEYALREAQEDLGLPEFK